MAGLFWQQSLPTSDETGLSEAVTKEANKSVEKILEEKRGGEKVGSVSIHMHFTPEQRAKIAKHAAECGNVATVRHFKNEVSNLGESTVRLFKKQYIAELRRKGHAQEITRLPKKKQGRPLILV